MPQETHGSRRGGAAAAEVEEAAGTMTGGSRTQTTSHRTLSIRAPHAATQCRADERRWGRKRAAERARHRRGAQGRGTGSRRRATDPQCDADLSSRIHSSTADKLLRWVSGSHTNTAWPRTPKYSSNAIGQHGAEWRRRRSRLATILLKRPTRPPGDECVSRE